MAEARRFRETVIVFDEPQVSRRPTVKAHVAEMGCNEDGEAGVCVLTDDMPIVIVIPAEMFDGMVKLWGENRERVMASAARVRAARAKS